MEFKARKLMLMGQGLGVANLIEKYGVDAQGLVQRYGGIEKCREIVEKAPEGAECYSWCLGDSGVRDNTVYLDDLRVRR